MNNPARKSIRLKISGFVVAMQSNFAIEELTPSEKEHYAVTRFKHFIYNSNQKPDIVIEIKVVSELPQVRASKAVFITKHYQDRMENWRLRKKENLYMYQCPLADKMQLMLINKAFDQVTAYLLPKKDKGFVWNAADIIYDFLQVLLINYLALRKEGFLVHGVGIKDIDGKGFLFAGESGSGKSTTAQLWSDYSKARVLNDDRIIVRKVNGRFFIFGSPWHGDFRDYLASYRISARLKKLFFIRHDLENQARPLSSKESFCRLYQNIFPPFWDKRSLANVSFCCRELVSKTDCFKLGFAKDRKIIGFVRDLSGGSDINT